MSYSKILLIPVFALIGGIIFMSCSPIDSPSKQSKELREAAMSTIQWHGVDDIPVLQKNSSKKILVDVYTDWCKWCKVMDQKTFADPAIIPYLQENYHMVKFNAETKAPITFNGKTYEFKEGGKRGYNELASALLGGKLSFPSVVVLDEDLNVVSVQKGFKDSATLKAALTQL